jgi:hypothetical protein
VEYSPKFFERDHSPVFLSKPKNDTVGRNSVSPTDYEISGSNDKDKSSENNTKDRNNCVECIEKDEKVRALEIEYVHARNRLDTEFEHKKRKLVEREVASRKKLEESNTKYRKYRKDWASVKKALEESKSESKMELEKFKNQLQTSKLSLEASVTKYRKLKQLLATKIFQASPSNEDLDNLLSLETETLFEKYEQITKSGSNSDKIKLEQTTETLQDVKNKLKLQTEQRENYEKQLSEIGEVLHLPAENCYFANILPYLKDLLEQNETNHCSDGLSIVESSSNT